MKTWNQSTVTEFIILGFPSTKHIQILLFISFLFTYILTILGNITLLVTLQREPRLRTPMYFFLSTLYVLEIGYTSVTVPKLLSVFLNRDRAISLSACLVQSYFFFLLGSTECFLLAAIAYDLYLAICNPLRYPALMSSKMCIQLALFCCVTGFLNPCLPTFLVSRLKFCGSIINLFFCDVPPLLSLSCTDAYVSATTIFISSSIIVLGSFLMTSLSYTCILVTILKMTSSKGCQKAFSTCTYHLTVVSLYYGTVIFMYTSPEAQKSMKVNKVVSVVYSVGTPMLNPIIYSLRNEDVKKTLRKMLLNMFPARK
ncbi:olfactory receptor 11L1-like [Alligator sinensis]|uniref:Olfactory receptor 11L1-like n=1 Tax=Alligator sinensis TaxID=38654 RepID=A0A3Q0HAE4_ALLSI|nr:olfactory receptor 11L1-like [Alligator sinensis]